MKRNEGGTTRGAHLFGRAVAVLGTLHGGTAVARPMELAFEERVQGSWRNERHRSSGASCSDFDQ